MTQDELRALAETLEHECALRLIAGGKNHEEAQACEQAADYLRAQADALPVGYVTANGLRSLRQDDATVLLYAHDYLIRPDPVALYTRPTLAAPQAERPCTCAPEDNPPIPCTRKYAFDDCMQAQAERAEPKRPQTCLWSRSDDDTDVWETACGNAFTINEGAPADNEMTFCCFCGRELKGEIGDSDADN